MMIQNDNMDNIFREAAGSYEVTPAPNAWQRLRRQLLWRKLRYVIGAGVFAVAVFLTFFIVSPEEESELVVDSATIQTEATLNTKVFAETELQQEPSVPTSEASKHVVNTDEKAGANRDVITRIGSSPVSAVTENIEKVEGFISAREELYFPRMELVPAQLEVSNQYLNPVMRSMGVFSNSSHQVTPDSAWLWSIEAYSGISFSRFSAFSGGLTGHQALRDEGSWILSPSYGTDMRVRKHGWFFSAGLAWNRVGQNVRFDVETPDLNPFLSHYDYDTTWVYIYDPPYYGEPFPAEIDSTFVATYYRQMYSGKLAVDYLTIPFMAGYEVKREEISVSCGVGLALSFPISWHGEAPNTVLNRLVSASEELSHKIDLSLLLRLEASARISPGYWVFFKPVVGFGLLNHKGQQSGLNYRNNSAGLDVGIRIDFNP